MKNHLVELETFWNKLNLPFRSITKSKANSAEGKIARETIDRMRFAIFNVSRALIFLENSNIRVLFFHRLQLLNLILVSFSRTAFVSVASQASIKIITRGYKLYCILLRDVLSNLLFFSYIRSLECTMFFNWLSKKNLNPCFSASASISPHLCIRSCCNCNYTMTLMLPKFPPMALRTPYSFRLEERSHKSNKKVPFSLHRF